MFHNPYRLFAEYIGDSAGAWLNIRVVYQQLLRFLLFCIRGVERDRMKFLLFLVWDLNWVLVLPRFPLLLKRFTRRFVHLSTKCFVCYCQASYQDEMRSHPIMNNEKYLVLHVIFFHLPIINMMNMRLSFHLLTYRNLSSYQIYNRLYFIIFKIYFIPHNLLFLLNLTYLFFITFFH